MHKEMILTDAQADGLAAFQNQRIHHNQFQRATARITNFHRSGARAYAPGILTLVGETGAGKSSIIENFCTVTNNGHDCSRVLSIIIPQSCTIKNLASRILHALGIRAQVWARESLWSDGSHGLQITPVLAC